MKDIPFSVNGYVENGVHRPSSIVNRHIIPRDTCTALRSVQCRRAPPNIVPEFFRDIIPAGSVGVRSLLTSVQVYHHRKWASSIVLAPFKTQQDSTRDAVLLAQGWNIILAGDVTPPFSIDRGWYEHSCRFYTPEEFPVEIDRYRVQDQDTGEHRPEPVPHL